MEIKSVAHRVLTEKIQSETNHAKSYYVSLEARCTCPGYIFGGSCKHSDAMLDTIQEILKVS